jgi:DNA-binding NarL/FixJ family response regulator
LEGKATPVDRLVGREVELDSFERMLDALGNGRNGAVELTGEAGIGKTRLLRELADRAVGRGHLVLSGAAAESERDVPFSVFVDALDPYLAGLPPPGVAALDEGTRSQLAVVFPSVSGPAGREDTPLQHERYRTHRAVRVLFEHLAATRPFVLTLDDVHWADPASAELLGALLRRPPAGPVAIALALRPLPLSTRLPMALERAHRAGSLVRIELATLTLAEAAELLAGRIGAAESSALHAESEGNPFYLEQLAKSLERSRSTPARPAPARQPMAEIGVPAAVAASLLEELVVLSDTSRRVFEGAAVAGDPFEPELAAAAAGVAEAVAMDAVDELVRLDLVRSTDVPLRFRFRHPLVRRAAYEGTAAAWRVGAHRRCSDALAARGAPLTVRAHHVERSARQGDVEAVAVLRGAGEATARLAPESAARWFGGALRLLTHDAPAEERVDLLLARARALAAAGWFVDSRAALHEAILIVPERSSALFTAVATATARIERFLGLYDDAHAVLERALRRLPTADGPESVELLIEMTLNEFYRSKYAAMRGWAVQAVEAAEKLGDPLLLAAALTMPALAEALTGRIDAAREHHARAAALVDGLSDEELARRLDTAAWLAAAELYLDLYAAADAHAGRALSIARALGRSDPFGLYQILPRVWYVRGKLPEAAELLDGAIEAARLLGTPPGLAGNLFNRSVIAVAVGDLDLAYASAEEAAQLSGQIGGGFVDAWAAVRLASVLLELRQPLIPGGWRAYGLDLLTRSWLAVDHRAEAARTADRAELAAETFQLPLARVWADRAQARRAFADGDLVRAVELALASAGAALAAGAPIEAALSRMLAGRALAADGQRQRAIAEFFAAATSFDECGTPYFRAGAERELEKLGQRPNHRARRGGPGLLGIDALTNREREIALLVVDRKTNHEIALELYLSQKTVETHLTNIFNKTGVSTRVALARAMEVRDRAPTDA